MATYYVNKSGNNSWDGTAETFQGGTVGPRLTINAGLQLLADNSADVLEIGDGTYAESIPGTALKSGASSPAGGLRKKTRTPPFPSR